MEQKGVSAGISTLCVVCTTNNGEYMGVYGSTWEYMTVHGCLRGVHGILTLCEFSANIGELMGEHGSTWECMEVHGISTLCVFSANNGECMGLHASRWENKGFQLFV